MGYQTVRALTPIRHSGVLRIPGQTTGDNAQDFVAEDTQANRLVALGYATSLGVAAAPLVPGQASVGGGGALQIVSSIYATRRDQNYLANAEILSPPPTVTRNTTGFPGEGFDQLADLVSVADAIAAMPVGFSNTFAQLSGTGFVLNATGGIFRFMYSGLKLLLYVKDSAASNRIRINGKLMEAGTFRSDANTWVKIEFATRDDRLIEFEFSRNGGLRGVYGEVSGVFRKPAMRPAKIAIAGDSQSANAVSDAASSNDNDNINLYPRLLGEMMNANIIQSATPSMGYVQGGIPLINRIDEFAGLGADAYGFVMGTNDAPYMQSTIPPSVLRPAVVTCIQKVMAANPGKPITVFGVLRSSDFATNVLAEQTIAEAAASFNSPYVRFYGFCSGTAPWLNANSKSWIIGPDGTHITLAGNRALAKYVGDCFVDHWSRL